MFLENTELARGKYTNSSGDGDRTLRENYENDLSGVKALTSVIKELGALSKLNVLENDLPEETQAEISSICASKGIELETGDGEVRCDHSPTSEVASDESHGGA